VLYAEPADEWVAAFVGDLVMLDGDAAGRSASTPLGHVALRRPMEGPVRVVVRPEQLVLGPATSGSSAPTPDGSPVGRVTLVEYHGPRTVYEVELGGPGGVADAAGAAVRVVALGPPRFAVGEAVTITPPPAPLGAFPVP